MASGAEAPAFGRLPPPRPVDSRTAPHRTAAPPRRTPKPPAAPPAKRRVNDIWLGRFERWALPRMARAMPRWVTPDVLTLAALAGAVLGGVGYALAGEARAWLWAVSAGLVLHWWGDSLDGTLARVRDERRERYGFFVDHTCDAVSVAVLSLGAGAGSLMRLDVALGLTLAVVLMMLHVMMVTVARDEFKISFGGVGPTELRLVVIAFNTVAWAVGPWSAEALGRTWTLFDLAALAVTAGVLAVWAVFAVREGVALARLDGEALRQRRDG